MTESDYWVYGLSETDFDNTVELARKQVEAQFTLHRQQAVRIRQEHPESADDILDDMGYYTYVDAQYVWHFCLWRLQAVLEGLIIYTFLRSSAAKGLVGLKAKLDAMRAAGYSLTEEDHEELLVWARLRNSLSHAPPEQFRPGPLTEEDVVEYHHLALKLCQAWRSEVRDVHDA